MQLVLQQYFPQYLFDLAFARDGLLSARAAHNRRDGVKEILKRAGLPRHTAFTTSGIAVQRSC
jgi:hypothetical protein